MIFSLGHGPATWLGSIPSWEDGRVPCGPERPNQITDVFAGRSCDIFGSLAPEQFSQGALILRNWLELFKCLCHPRSFPRTIMIPTSWWMISGTSGKSGARQLFKTQITKPS